MNLSQLNGSSATHSQWLSPHALVAQNRRFKGTTGVSEGNRNSGFRPAFSDSYTGQVFLSRFADGRLAPMHLLDGLPACLVLARSASGRVTTVKKTVSAGFERDGQFYTREQAAAATQRG